MNRFKNVKKASIYGMLGNLFLFAIKVVAGLVTNSNAMIADAFNSASDIFSSVMTFIGNKIASKPSDDDHNLGHGKAEYIYSLLISVAMFILSFVVFKDSLSSIVNDNEYIFSYVLVIVCIITIVIKLILFIYTNFLYKNDNNLLIKANSLDHRNDVIITFFNLLSSFFWIK